MASLVHSPSYFSLPTPAERKSSLHPFNSGVSSSYMAGLHNVSPPQPQPVQHTSTAERHHIPSKSFQKRRHDEDEDEDQSMERSPAPERRTAGRTIPKRLRVGAASQPDGEGGNNASNKESKQTGVDDVDVGLLLARLSPPSLLSLVTSLISSEPNLKSKIISLIPPPALDAALEALAQAAKKLRDAYPYSIASPTVLQSPPFPQAQVTGSVFGSRTTLSWGFGASNSGFGSARGGVPSPQPDGLRDEYVLSRLRPHISEFITVCFSFLPYFSCSPHHQSPSPSHEQASASDIFDYLAAITNHLIAQPTLAQSSLAPTLFPRLLQEWMAWVDKVDVYLNQSGKMFGQDVVRGWERGLDTFAAASVTGVSDDMKMGLKSVRDKWVSRVGWVVGRRVIYSMDEEKEM